MQRIRNIFSSVRTYSKTAINQIKNCDTEENELKTELDFMLNSNSENDDFYVNKCLKFLKNISLETFSDYNSLAAFEYYKVSKQMIHLLELMQEDLKIYLAERAQNCSHKIYKIQFLKFPKKRPELFMTLIKVISMLTYFSKVFRIKFNQYGGTELILNFLSDKYIILECINACQREPVKNEDIANFLKNAFGSVYNISKSARINHKKAVRIFTKIIVDTDRLEDYLIPAYFLLAKYSNNKEENNLFPNKGLFFEKLLVIFQSYAVSIRENQRIHRLCFDNDRFADVSIMSKSSLHLNLIDVLNTISFLIRNDLDLIKMIEIFKIENLIKSVLLKGNDFEVEFAVRILFELCFCEKFQGNDEILISMIRRIVIYQYPNKVLIRYCEGVLWLKFEKQKHLEKSQNEARILEGKKKIMISYDNQDQAACMELENVLRELGFAVWMKDIYSYTLEENILAIRSSDCVILALSNYYARNLNCRLEAEIAREIGLKLCPVALHTDFVFNDWISRVTEKIDLIEFYDNQPDTLNNFILKIQEKFESAVPQANETINKPDN